MKPGKRRYGRRNRCWLEIRELLLLISGARCFKDYVIIITVIIVTYIAIAKKAALSDRC